MTERKMKIINKLGLHARAAAKLVQLTSSFDSEIHIRRVDSQSNIKTINGKSIMGVMMLAANKGTEITLIVEGDDEADAVLQIEQLVNDRFGEGE